jgi:hypothetical protein
MKYEPFMVPCVDFIKQRDIEHSLALELFDRFMQVQLFRVVQLTMLVRSTDDGGTWLADGSRESLDQLMGWLSRRLKRCDDGKLDLEWGDIEFAGPALNLSFACDGLTTSLLSLVVDVSIYYAECYRRAIPGMFWKCVTLKSRSMLHSPALVGPILSFELVPWVNMVHFVHDFASGDRPASAVGDLFVENLALPRDPGWAKRKRW